jgi:hypothetical protein
LATADNLIDGVSAAGTILAAKRVVEDNDALIFARFVCNLREEERQRERGAITCWRKCMLSLSRRMSPDIVANPY